MKTWQICAGSAAALLLTGCVTSVSLTRGTHPQFFELLAAAAVPKGAVQDVADCLHDGFARSHFVYTNIKPAVTRRIDGFRVEAKTNNIVSVSVDILDTGAMEYHQMKHARLTDLSGERLAFTSCVQVHGGHVTKPFDGPPA